MKNFHLFTYADCEPYGAMDDYNSSHNTLDEALEQAKISLTSYTNTFHIVEAQENGLVMVCEGEKEKNGELYIRP